MRNVFANVVPLAISWSLGFGLIRLGSATKTQWLLLNGAEIISTAAGLAIAHRAGGRVALYLLAGSGAYSAAMFAVHNGVSPRAAQGGPVHMAVMAAAFIGVAAGMLVRKETSERPVVVSQGE
jgi:hypothetical protein